VHGALIPADTFAANRAVGRVEVAVKQRAGLTRRAHVFEDGPLRVRFAGAPAREAEAVIVNTAGGIAGGDRLDLDVTVREGAALIVTSAAAEKIYRSPAKVSSRSKSKRPKPKTAAGRPKPARRAPNSTPERKPPRR
jgi:urease accessory protein UreH